jgi:hypothetical protein
MSKKPFYLVAQGLIDSLQGKFLISEVEGFSLEGHILTLRSLSVEGERTTEFNMNKDVKFYDFMGHDYIPKLSCNGRRMFFDLVMYDGQVFIATMPEKLGIEMYAALQKKYIHKQSVPASNDTPRAMIGIQRIYHAVEFAMGQDYIGFSVRIESGNVGQVNFEPESIGKVCIYNTKTGKVVAEFIDHNGGAVSFYMDGHMGMSFTIGLRSVVAAHRFTFDIEES